MAERIENERFGEKVELPEGYQQFWKEYQHVLAEGDGILGEPVLYSWMRCFENPKHLYLNRRINFLLSEAGMIRESDRNKLVFLTRTLESLPVIKDIDTVHWKRDDNYGSPTIPASAKVETIISLQPTIETSFYENEISRYRKISPELEKRNYGRDEIGNSSKVGVLLELFEDYYASQEKQWQEHCIHGNELRSIPSTYPIEKEIAQLYERIGRNKFDLLVEKYFDLRRVLENARKIDSRAVAGLEKSVHEQYQEIRKEILAGL